MESILRVVVWGRKIDKSKVESLDDTRKLKRSLSREEVAGT